MQQASKGDHVRFEYLDALRAFAILGVLSIHCALFCGGTFPGSVYAFAGANGVQLFFMISAFTIFLTLESALARGGHLMRDFYIRRFFRILPMFWVGIAIYSFAPGREHASQLFNVSAIYYILSAALLHGWHPFVINSIVPGGWSIAVEATFYIVAPFIFLLIRKWQTALVFFFLTLLPLQLLNHLLIYAYYHHWIFRAAQPEMVSTFAYRWFPSQFPVFACGILGFRIVQALPAGFFNKLNGRVFMLSAAAGLYSIAGAPGDAHGRLIPNQVNFAFCFLLFILSLAVFPHPWFVNRGTCFLGRISYSFYLLHFVIIAVVVDVLHSWLPGIFSHPLVAYVTLFIATLLLAVPASYLTYKVIEQPFIHLGRVLILRLGSERKSAAVEETSGLAGSTVTEP
jgi:peptidoglycan/LPS O-acetylase OafA/YrhL